MSDDQANHINCLTLLREGAAPDWEELAQLEPGFPTGRERYRDHPWIHLAVQSGSLGSVTWMIAQGVDLNIVSSGYTVLQTALERNAPDHLEMLEVLLKAGANPNGHGINDWTALHMAAVHENLGAMDILLKAGAQRDARTGIDDYATPEEEARRLGHPKAADFLRDWAPDPVKPRPKARR